MSFTTKQGRVMVRMPQHPRAHPNGYVYRSIVVAEKKIGRRISRREKVHHRDRNRGNDRPGNLVVYRSQREHMAHHRNRINTRCSHCRRKMWVYPSRRGTRNYCSRACGSHANKGCPKTPRPRTIPRCHPERRHRALGLCNACYLRRWSRGR